jgi:hypothetical protein
VIAALNGAGKTRFAGYLRDIARVIHFVHADLIAGGLSPLKPELVTIAAARIVPRRSIDRRPSGRISPSKPTSSKPTSAGVHTCRLQAWKAPVIASKSNSCTSVRSTWRSSGLARVRQLGHDVPSQGVLRCFDRSAENFLESTNPWRNHGLCTTIHGLWAAIREEEMKAPKRSKRSESFAAGVGRALRQAAQTARKTARMHGTPIYIVEDGKIVAKRP